jgi:hypothetical protein
LKFLSFSYEILIGFEKAKIEFFYALLLHKNCGTQSGEGKTSLEEISYKSFSSQERDFPPKVDPPLAEGCVR